jgi:hypothetical protein
MDNVAELDELPKLTPKQNAFVNALLEGKNAATLIDKHITART